MIKIPRLLIGITQTPAQQNFGDYQSVIFPQTQGHCTVSSIGEHTPFILRESMSQQPRPSVKIRPAIFPDDQKIVGQLFLAYAESLPISLDFQNFEHELAGLPGKYTAENGGAVWLAYTTQTRSESDSREQENYIGCIAIRPFFHPTTTPMSASLAETSTSAPSSTCELKRLYLTPASRGLGVSRLLMDVALSKARELGYREMLLDTLRTMTPARKLYKGYGFEETGSYYENPNDVVFYRLIL
jgi:ribosomal protein S18 acetylase RimI-like enzyme